MIGRSLNMCNFLVILCSLWSYNLSLRFLDALMIFCTFFFFNDTATTEIYTLSLHDALPISAHRRRSAFVPSAASSGRWNRGCQRSEEHTSELQSRRDLVCRLLLEKKKIV